MSIYLFYMHMPNDWNSCSKVLACGTSRQLIDRAFMIVTYIPSIVMTKAELTEEKQNDLHRQMRMYLAKLH